MAESMTQKEEKVMLRCELAELVPLVGLLNTILPTRTPKPILENILFEIRGDKLYLFGTDETVGLQVEVKKVEPLDSGSFLVPGAKLVALLREMDGETVEFHKEEGFVKVVCGDDEFRLLSLSPSDFPDFADASGEETLRLPAEEFREMLHKTSFAAATEASRYTMNSVLLDMKNGTLNVVATDGKRLALTRRDIELDESYFLLLPLKGVKLLEKVLAQGEEEAALFIQEGQLLVQVGSQTLYLRLLQGNYPPYENVIPDEYPLKVKISSHHFHKALRKSALLTTADSKSVRLHFQEANLTLYSNDPNVGEAKVSTALETPIAEELEISFNPLLLMDPLKVLGEQSLHLELRDPKSPCIFREENFVYVVMPLNL